ncbi:hypothetical protein AAG570_004644 [Ranatra chinensis]|uniref:Uncharacterized protein n=1 Tax=Ranatra chinensis TaxID=642074 RepID=A0ABD0YE28_9HEMI
MASKRGNMFYQNKKQETTEIGTRSGRLVHGHPAVEVAEDNGHSHWTLATTGYPAERATSARSAGLLAPGVDVSAPSLLPPHGPTPSHHHHTSSCIDTHILNRYSLVYMTTEGEGH